MSHPATRAAVEVPYKQAWQPTPNTATRSRGRNDALHLTPKIQGLEKHLHDTMIWKWYKASQRMEKTKRAPTCMGLGAEVQDFIRAAEQELSWWPTQPITDWIKQRILADPRNTTTGPQFDEQFRVQETALDYKAIESIGAWAQMQVQKLREHEWDDEVERALIADKRYTQEWNENEQIHMWELME